MTASQEQRNGHPVLEARGVTKAYGNVVALDDVSISVDAGAVTCLLGDNGAGKSTLIKILSGVVEPDHGTISVDGVPQRLTSPRDALDRGIATVFQDLAIVPIMPVYRNFFVGREPNKGRGIARRLDIKKAREITREQLREIGIDLRDVTLPIANLSGGERQCVAIARAVYFGARVLILDEPTSALGVKEAEIVLRYIMRARSKGLGVIFITHNVHHAYPIGDRFTILRRGKLSGTFTKAELTPAELVRQMAGGEELERVARDLETLFGAAPVGASTTSD